MPRNSKRTPERREEQSQRKRTSWRNALSGDFNRRYSVVLALLFLGTLALPLYQRILQVAGTYQSEATTLFWPLLGVTALSVGACWLILRAPPAERRGARCLELALILVLGLAARAVFFGAPPTLSLDAYRYVWDAHLLAHGVSPYTHTPLDPAITALRDQAIWPHLRFRDAPTIYPPGAQLLYLLAYLIAPLNIFALKGVIEVCDALVAVLTLLLLRQHRLDLRRVILYWWSPLPILEFAFSSHIDAAAILWTLAALLVLGQRWRGPRVLAGVLLGLATLTKFYPVLFVLVMLQIRPRLVSGRVGGLRGAASRGALQTRGLGWVAQSAPFLLALAGTVLAGYLPFLQFHAQSGGFLATYFQQSFADQGILLQPITFLVNLIGTSAHLVLALQALALGSLCLLVGYWWWRRGWRPESGVLALNVVWIMLATHLFPWYVVILLPLLALYLRVPRLLMSPKIGASARSPGRGAGATSDLAGGQPAPAQTLWLFALLMPFILILFAPGSQPEWFKLFFFIPLALLALAFLRQHSLALLRALSRRPAITRPTSSAPMEEFPHATHQPNPSPRQPANQAGPDQPRGRPAAARTVSGDD